MTKSSNLGYPRIGEKREWKKALEQYWKGNIGEQELQTELENLRLYDLKKQKDLGIDLIPVGDFSLYDHVLDTAVMFGLIPERFQHQDEKSLQTYFDIARGNKDAVASEMTKWFNTNYHYIVPEVSSETEPRLVENRLLPYFLEAKEKHGIIGKPVLLGPVSLLKLAKGYENKDFDKLVEKLVPLYIQVLQQLELAGAEWVQIDEPILATTLTEYDINVFKKVYQSIDSKLSSLNVLLQTYFESVDHYEEVVSLPVAGIGLDFVHDEGANLEALKKYGFPADKSLAAGIINGRNIWKDDLNTSLTVLETLRSFVNEDRLIVQPSCSLLHVPVTVETEYELHPQLKNALAFADQKLEEINLLTEGLNKGRQTVEKKLTDQAHCREQLWKSASRNNEDVQKEVEFWKGVEPTREQHFAKRQTIHQNFFNLPLLPTTTIGSLPQTTDIRQGRLKWRRGDWSDADYQDFVEANIKEWVARQEEIGLDVLIHGEFERNDMVEFFGEKLDGFAFTRYAWVQSYGSRCVKPPIIYGDIALTEPMTVKEISFAQSLTEKPVKGMLTGPITILNWSFVREDISEFDVTKQIALALQKEIRALEENQIHMIQVDEPALREGLPLKPKKQQQYLDEAVYAFKLATSAVKNETQIHTHMCYSEFGEIMNTIDELDADVISIEAARSHGELIADFEEQSYEKGIGLGVYDIHSPRVPEVEEMERYILRALKVLDPRQFWVNPDCGLKTRDVTETTEALTNMVKAAHHVREKVEQKSMANKG
ncbi:5-methyltetrahydropteroyltriglutamate--homocysteine methyltransferase [Halobacillus andaensis]|uniref:5-methyltetrahydropteroyltriglutamate--homocysteine methyltransferase n=2 Tax=Halobacillus andaensis TaxID=1176239 RepID=A0A917B2E0_HALAA|nr:5-methyltetrahydropteroyltriglutamate--homocysteine S-methyltransferase [Halobacillus andaensis]MBP2003809.1 5-methyltetrahydropteroyltriglutamate--homocysteine methyltransferase [Halobacillus andaensis]GGF13411.1 5-methyltetrahydropteroyltriglutamate--homocysteine methyltransferase [Halobacillus andaensis]